MKKTILILLSILSLCACSKEAWLYNTQWYGEIVNGPETKFFNVSFYKNGTCTYWYKLTNTEDPAKDSAEAAQTSYTYEPPQITIQYGNPYSGEGSPTYPNITGTVQDRSMTLTIKGDVFTLSRK